MGFQVFFNISKIKKTLQTDWPNTFCQQLERKILKKCFRQNHKDNYSGSCKPKNSTSHGFPYQGVRPTSPKFDHSHQPRKITPNKYFQEYFRFARMYEFELESYFHVYKVCLLIEGTNHFHKFTVATNYHLMEKSNNINVFPKYIVVLKVSKNCLTC